MNSVKKKGRASVIIEIKRNLIEKEIWITVLKSIIKIDYFED